MNETFEQAIQRLKNNWLPWIALNGTEQDCLRKANPHIENLLYSGDWEHLENGYGLNSPGANAIFRISPDYHPTPKTVDLPIVQYEGWLGVLNGEHKYSWLCPFTHLHCLPSLPRFRGFWSKNKEVFLEQVARETEQVVARFEVTP
jgi:hypothetical protein